LKNINTDLLIIKTGFGENRGKPSYINNSPIVSSRLAKFLKSKLPNLRAVGFDFISISSLKNREEGRKAHKEFLSRDILIVEDMNLEDLQINPDSVLVSLLFIDNSDGGPVTVWAFYKSFDLDNFPECFTEYADLLHWDKSWDTILDTSDAPCWKWFVGGRINACYNCVDRHLEKNKNKTAIHFVPEPENERIQHITYQELYVQVNEMAALLQDFAGLKAGDTVTLHLPMTAELPITMLACARLGVIHCEVFGGFSGKACADRIEDAKSRVLITIDGYYRNGKLIDHKQNADIAVDLAKKAGQKVDKVLVWQRYPGKNINSDTDD